MAQRLRNGVVFLQGHDGEFTFYGETWIAHGDIEGATHEANEQMFKETLGWRRDCEMA